MSEETRNELSEFMKQSGKSQKQISKETGFSPAVINQYLKDVYKGDIEKVTETISRYLQIGRERMSTASGAEFYRELYNTKEVFFACRYAHRNNEMALVCGDAGAGKTTALNRYSMENTGVIFVTANACITSPTAILELIYREIGEKQIPSKRAALMNALVEKLTGTNRLIIIDEADHLTLNALQAVRNLNDKAGVGIVFSGNDKIYRQMLSPRRGYEFDQLRTRIPLIKKVVNDYSVIEMEKMFPSVNQDCISFLLKLADSESLRTADKLFSRAKELAKARAEPFLIKHLKTIQEQFLGKVITI